MNQNKTGVPPLMAEPCQKLANLTGIDRKLLEAFRLLADQEIPLPEQFSEVQKYELLSLLRAQIRANEARA